MNHHEDLARWKKASAIADMFEHLARSKAGLDAERPSQWVILVRHVESAEPLIWRQVAVMAGQRPPSEATQRLVLEILRGRGQCAGVDLFARVSQ